MDDDASGRMKEENRIEQAFTLLGEAKSFESTFDYWNASERFVTAHEILTLLAEEASAKVGTKSTTSSTVVVNTNNNNNDDHDHDNDELIHIATLYSTKAHEYWNESRRCLILAMERERDADDERYSTKSISMNSGEETTTATTSAVAATAAVESESPSIVTAPSQPRFLPSKADVVVRHFCTTLDDDQAQTRNATFTKLFSRFVMVPPIPEYTTTTLSSSTAQLKLDGPINTTTATTTSTTSSSVLDQQWSIEERLHELNKSLPSGFKTTEERMSDINIGLNKLGLSLYTPKEPFSRFNNPDSNNNGSFRLPKSEEEQMEEIMAQVADEAAIEAAAAANSATIGSVRKDDNDSQSDPFSDDDDDDDGDDELLLEDDQLAIKAIRKRVVRAQGRIAELVALLDHARDAKDRVDQLLEEDGVTPRPQQQHPTITQRTGNNHKRVDDAGDGDDDDDDDSEAREALNESVSKADVAFFLGSGKRKLKSANRNLRRAMKEWEESSLM
jgi:hypothetical protein